MQPFIYIRAKNNEAAIHETQGNNTAKFIAGGTNIIDLMKLDVEKPQKIIDINDLKLQTIEVLAGGGFRIGALVKNSDLAYDANISSKYPVLSQALLSGASAQIRNMATVGGNVLQRTRCPYFYDVAFACNKRDPGSGCDAIKGYNRNHAVLGTSDKCIATSPSDMCVALAALDAVIRVQGANGERKILFTEFHLVPGDTPEKENVLQAGELITAVELPAMPYAAKSHYLKVRDRSSFEFALTSAAVALDISNGKINAARIALGGVGTKPWRAKNAEEILIGLNANEESYQKAAEAAMRGAKPHQYNTFKIELAKRTIVRALSTAGGMV